MSEVLKNPRIQAEITPEWFTSVLHDAGLIGEAVVTAVDVTEVGVGRGYICLTVRLTPNYSPAQPDAPSSFVMKMPSPMTYPEEDLVRLIGEFAATEAYWYRDLAAESPVRVARCYWHSVDVEAGCSWLLLEDLGTLRAIDQATGCSLPEVQLAVTALARIHGRWWERPEVRQLPWLTGPAYQGELWQRRSLGRVNKLR